MPDDKPIHYRELAKILAPKLALPGPQELDEKKVYWYIRVRRDAGHVKEHGKRTGFFVKTKKGKKFQAEAELT